MRSKQIIDICRFIGQYGLKPNDLARICEINPSQMRQYTLGLKQPRTSTIIKINQKVRQFAEKLGSMTSV